MAQPRRPAGGGPRRYALLTASLAASVGLRDGVDFTTPPAHRRVRVRLAAFKPGDVVQLMNQGEWHDAVVDSEDASGKIKVHFRKGKHEYHLFPSLWRVPVSQASSVVDKATGNVSILEGVKAQAAVSSQPKLEEKSLKVGKKLKGRVLRKTNSGLLVDVGLPVEAHVHRYFLPDGELQVGQEVDVWVRKHSGIFKFTLINIWKYTGLVDQWLNATVVGDNPVGYFVLHAQTPDGGCIPGLLSHYLTNGLEPAKNATLRVKVMSMNHLEGRCDFTMQPNVEEFVNFTADEWLNGTVWEGDQPNYGVMVNVVHPGTGRSRIGLVRQNQLPEHATAGGDLKPGQPVRVRITEVDVAAQKLTLSLLPAELQDFQDVPQEQWLTGRVDEVLPDEGLMVHVENPKGGEGVQGWLARDQIGHGFTAEMDAELGQEVKVRVLRAARGLSLTMKDMEDLAAFADAPEDKWMDAEVVQVSQGGLNVQVVPPNGGPPRVGRVYLEDVRVGLVEDAASEAEVGETRQVRLIREELDAGNLCFSMKPKQNLSAFEPLLGTERLKGTVVGIGGSAAALVVPSPVGGRPIEGVLPLEEVEEGQDVALGAQLEVRVTAIDSARCKLRLTAKSMSPLWVFASALPQTRWFNGTVVGTASYGVFVDVEAPGGTATAKGLVHVSKLGNGLIKDVSDVTKGQAVQVRIIKVDHEKGNLVLSMRK